MGHLSDGVWSDDEHWSTDDSGRFVRGASQFRRREGEPLVPERGRNHLYLAHPCPWCHRTAIVRELKGLQEVVSVSFVSPLMREGRIRPPLPTRSQPVRACAGRLPFVTTETGRSTRRMSRRETLCSRARTRPSGRAPTTISSTSRSRAMRAITSAGAPTNISRVTRAGVSATISRALSSTRWAS